MKELLSIIAPMYNEELLVEKYCTVTLDILKTINDYDYEILLVNDGSTDKTYEKMLEMQEKYPKEIGVICESRNFGLEGAVSAGLKITSGDVVVVMDADLQDPPCLIPQMLEKIKQGNDIVIASRIKRSNDSLFKRLTANIYYKILDNLSGKLKLEKSAANYRMMTKRVVNEWRLLSEVNGVFRVTIPYLGMKTDIVEYEREKRLEGKTKYNFKSMLRYAISSITGISVEPLIKIIGLLPVGAIFTLVSLIAFFFSSGYWRASWLVVLLVSLLTEMMLLGIIIIGIYIGEIFVEVKHRPTSIIYKYDLSVNAKNRKEE